MKQYAFVNAKILDGTENMTVQEGMTVLVENGRILSIEKNGEVPSGFRRIDLKGSYLMPGMINMHCHLPGSGKIHNIDSNTSKLIKKQLGNPIGKKIMMSMCYKNALAGLMSGVTTVRTVGGLGELDSEIRDSIDSGKKIGPRILVANTAVSVPGGHMTGTMAYGANNVEEAVNYVRQIAEGKPDLIKLMITGGVLDASPEGLPGALKMPEEIVKAACDEAHKLGYKVAAHVLGREGMRVSARCGVDTIEHGAEITEEEKRLMKEHGTAVICTLSPVFPMKFGNPAETGLSEAMCKNGSYVFDGIASCAKECLEYGILVGLGTDTGCPYIMHYDFWRELMYFQHFVGVSNAYAIYTATLLNAKIAGISDETGSIEVGKSADLIVLKDNPLEDLHALSKPVMVAVRGELIEKPKAKHNEAYDKVINGIHFD